MRSRLLSRKCFSLNNFASFENNHANSFSIHRNRQQADVCAHVCDCSISLSSLFLSCWSQQIWNAWLFHHTFSMQLTMMIHSHRNYWLPCDEREALKTLSEQYSARSSVPEDLWKVLNEERLRFFVPFFSTLDVICCFLRILFWPLFHDFRN